MSEKFFTSTRGCVHKYGDGNGRGFYKFEPDIGQPGRILINGGDIDEGDIIMPAVTLSQNKILYTFGPDWGKSTISGVILLGESSEGGALMQTLISWFQTNRAGVKSEPVKLSIPGNKAYSVFVHRLIIGTPDPEYNIQPFGLAILVQGASK